jgi:hypothetical protein
MTETIIVVLIAGALLIFGAMAFVGAIRLVNISFQQQEATHRPKSVLSMAFQIIAGAAGLIAINSPAYFVLNHPNRIGLDKDDIAGAMVLGIGLFFASVLINIGAAVGVLILMLRKKWEIAAGVLLAFG